MEKKYILRGKTNKRRHGVSVYIGESGKQQADAEANRLTESGVASEPLEVVEMLHG